MKIFNNKTDLKKEILGKNNISFVPTMGGLHAGHKYLIKRAKKTAHKVLVSIYVNPKQFNVKIDFKNYPRNIELDLKILKNLNVDYVYLPEHNDIFKFKSKKKIYLDQFSRKLCGKFRKNHFKGVVTVVNQFLDIIKPKNMYLGNKDFQQLYLIKKHIQKRKIKTNIIECKTIREKNGVACSSRNRNLSSNDLLTASKIYRYLKKQKLNFQKNNFNNHMIKKIIDRIKKFKITKLDYFEIINLHTLKKQKALTKINGGKSINNFNFFIAYYLHDTRMIDNF